MAPKRKASEISTKKTAEDVVAEIKQLESTVHSSKTNANNLLSIQTILAEGGDDIVVLTAIQAPRRIFPSFLKNADFSIRLSEKVTKSMTAPRLKFHEWALTQAKKYILNLAALIANASHDEVSDGVILAAIDALMDLAVEDAQSNVNYLSSIDAIGILAQVCMV